MSTESPLLRSSALIVGAGGLGSPASLALAASGVGRIGLVDDDVVDLSNLARQILHRTADLGRPKVESGAERLRMMTPGVVVDTHRLRLDDKNAGEVICQYDVVVDGSDNLATKLLVNDACILQGRPLVTGGILRFFGQVLSVIPERTACYRCVFGNISPDQEGPSCGEAGVFGGVAGMIGMIQAGEAIRILSGLPPAWGNRLLAADLWRGKFDRIELSRDPDCAVCGSTASAHAMIGRMMDNVDPIRLQMK
jgi:molybdopterin/thiamine biosynthesis adenylyltransferase